MKLPAIQFYPGDWLRDSVSGCSIAAQGLWFRMLLMMHDSDRYGHLVMNGSPIPPGFVARRCGCATLEQYETLLAELDSVSVPSRTPEGVIYSRRMVRDEAARAVERDRKRTARDKSGGCPGSVRRTSGGKEDEDEDEDPPPKPKTEKHSPAEDIYALYPRKVGRVAAIKAIAAVLTASEPGMKDRLVERTAAYATAVAKWPPADQQFIPHPATWFNRGSFDDDPSTWLREQPQRNGNGHHPASAPPRIVKRLQAQPGDFQ